MRREYIETDLGAASYLHVIGYELQGLRDISPSRAGFVFIDPCHNAARDAAAYFAGAAVTAEKYAISIRKLKAVLRSRRVENMESKKDEYGQRYYQLAR